MITKKILRGTTLIILEDIYWFVIITYCKISKITCTIRVKSFIPLCHIIIKHFCENCVLNNKNLKYESINSIQSWSATWPRIWLQLTSFARLRCETPHRLQCIWTLYTIYWFVKEWKNFTCWLIRVVGVKWWSSAISNLKSHNYPPKGKRW